MKKRQSAKTEGTDRGKKRRAWPRATKRKESASEPVRDRDIDTSDIPDLGNTTGWVRGLMYRPVTRPISIRFPAPDIAMAQQLARKKGVPYQTYIKMLLHEALERETGAAAPR